MRACRPYLWRNGRSLHLVEQRAYLCKMLDVCTIWVYGVIAFRTCREALDDELPSDPQVNLEMKAPRNRVFPQLPEWCFSTISLFLTWISLPQGTSWSWTLQNWGVLRWGARDLHSRIPNQLVEREAVPSKRKRAANTEQRLLPPDS